MAKIVLSHAHSRGEAGAHAAVEQIVKALRQRFPNGESNWSLRGCWTGNRLPFTGKGIAGVAVAGANLVRVEIHLSGLIALVKPLVEREVEAYLTTHL